MPINAKYLFVASMDVDPDIDGPHVLVSAAWAEAVELGRWPSHVRPYTRNRQHALYKVC